MNAYTNWVNFQTSEMKGHEHYAAVTGLSDEQQASIWFYTSVEYPQINKALRNQELLQGNYTKIVANIDSGLESLPCYSGKVYRKLAIDSDRLGSLKVGSKFIEKAYVSTSKSPDVTVSGTEAYTFVIRHKNGRDIKNCSMNPHEEEVLFVRNTEFKVISYDSISKTFEIEEV